jgi:hypothetical protein
MEFLNHQMIKGKVRTLLSAQQKTKIAVAYWGSDALKLLGLNPKRTNLQVLCCLKGGSSDPDVIKRFGQKARQIDNLHAKVFWTPKGAVVGSANASANGLPEQEEFASKLIEAGVFIKDGSVLAKIGQWFDGLYDPANSRPITSTDLANARRDRRTRMGKTPPKRSLIEALEANPSEFSQQRIYLYLYEEFCDDEEWDSCWEDAKNNMEKMRSTYANINDFTDDNVIDVYTFYRKPPSDYFPMDAILIEGKVSKDRKIAKRHFYFRRTFKSVSQREISVGGTPGLWMPILAQTSGVGFNYNLSDRDRTIISKAANQLWSKGRKGVENDVIISLADARPILLKHSQGF